MSLYNFLQASSFLPFTLQIFTEQALCGVLDLMVWLLPSHFTGEEIEAQSRDATTKCHRTRTNSQGCYYQAALLRMD